ncbi:MAG TPA: AMP-binding protein, partial [Longimicrobium sp.]
YVALGPDEVVLQAAPVSFDASTLELWGPLLNGGRLALVPAGPLSVEEIGRTIRRHGVTTLWLTAGLFQVMVDERPEELGGVRQLLTGGDVVPVEQAMKLRRRFPGIRLINGYGPTENTTFTCCHTVADGWDGGPLPIGRPIAGTHVCVLDPALRPVPAGVAGELYAGGAGVARGYLGWPAPTAERFLPDPFAAEPGARMYRTGDRVRWRADGTLEFLGRLDGQVKVRGFRVEPGEIESALLRHPEVERAVVAPRPGGAAGTRLVAYVVGRGGAAPTAAELRGHLREHLPEHLVPAAFVAVDSIPLTPNGKVDRGALPDPVPDAAAPYAPPRTPVEAALAEAWGEVLGVERVGMDDNYFALGGDSIRSLRLVAAVQRRGLSLSISQLYRHHSVRELAAALEPSTGDAGTTHPSREPFALLHPEARSRLADDVEDAYPVSRVQLGMLYHTERDPASLVYHEVLNYRVQTSLDEKAMREALRRVAARHPLLRTSFDLGASPEPIQRVHRQAEIPLEVVDLRHLDGPAQDAWVDREKERGFDWTRPPLLRVRVHRLAEDTFRLVLVEHHAVLDGWSVASLMTELLRLYVALRDGAAGPTGAPPVTRFRDFVALEREAMASPESRGFWRRVVDGAPVA